MDNPGHNRPKATDMMRIIAPRLSSHVLCDVGEQLQQLILSVFVLSLLLYDAALLKVKFQSCVVLVARDFATVVTAKKSE